MGGSGATSCMTHLQEEVDTAGIREPRLDRAHAVAARPAGFII